MPTPEEIKKALEEKASIEKEKREIEEKEKNKVSEGNKSAPAIPSQGTIIANSPLEQAKIQEKLEDKSVESVRADLSAERANPGREGSVPVVAGQTGGTVQREDGTITSVDHPEETAHYIGGSRVMITDEQKKKIDALSKEMNDLQGNRGISDIAVDDPYWTKKRDLDNYITKLKK